MTFNAWVKKYNGKKLDYDKQFGVQCVDLIKHFIKHVLEVEPQSIGNAIEYYNKRNTSKFLKENFKNFDYRKGFNYKKGDVLVLKGSSRFGHICVLTGEQNKKGVYGYDQNYKGTGAGMTKRFYEYDGFYTFLNVLRPKAQKKINGEKTAAKAEPKKPAAAPKPSPYFPKYEGKSKSIADALSSLHFDSSYKYRKKIAKANKITAYIGTPKQNKKLLDLLKKGKLLKP